MTHSFPTRRSSDLMLGTVLVCAVLVLVADRIGTFIGGDEINLGYFLPFVTAVVMCIQAVTYPLAMSLMDRSEEHTSELQSLMRISYAVFCLKKKIINNIQLTKHIQ